MGMSKALVIPLYGDIVGDLLENAALPDLLPTYVDDRQTRLGSALGPPEAGLGSQTGL